MPVFKVKVKWGKDLFKDVEANTDEDPMLFKAQLFALTGVPPDRQKVVIKGANLKDWTTVQVKDGTQMLLLGSKEEDMPHEPVEKTVFLEDMNESELATAMDVPVGLSNLGNTCYLNATLQCLKTVPELREVLNSFNQGRSSLLMDGSAEGITRALRDLYAVMDRSGKEVLPIILLQRFHLAFPQFAEKSPQGGYQQQDANECWTELSRLLQQKLSPIGENDNEIGTNKPKSFIDQYFGGVMNYEMKCTEADETVTTGTETFLQLSCFISPEVRFMLSGLKNKLQEPITKHSLTLNRDAVYQKTSKINRLPAYLTVQFVRFYYKENHSINAKILKDIKFPIDFDAFDLCTPELQEKLTPMRAKFKEAEDKMIEEQLQLKKFGQDVKDKTSKSSENDVTPEPFSFPDDIGSNNSGYYTLKAVLTHKGRTSSSGHYVAWIRHKNDVWFMCDDENVSPVTEEDVLKLSGGGDWHIAYVLLYGPKLLRLPIEQSKE